MVFRSQEQERPKAPMILGGIGGLLGIVAGFVAIFVGGGLLAEGQAGPAVVIGVMAIFLGIAGIAAAGMSLDHPETATFVLVSAGILGFVFVTFLWILPAALLLTGALFAWRSRYDERLEPA